MALQFTNHITARHNSEFTCKRSKSAMWPWPLLQMFFFCAFFWKELRNCIKLKMVSTAVVGNLYFQQSVWVTPLSVSEDFLLFRARFFYQICRKKISYCCWSSPMAIHTPPRHHPPFALAAAAATTTQREHRGGAAACWARRLGVW